MLLSEFIKKNTRALAALYPEEEARSMVLYYCSETFGLPGYMHITEPLTEVPQDMLEDALADMERLAAAEPLQYVLGYTEFCGRIFDVDPRALIPRAETEVLCQKAEELAKGMQDLRILDLCTGSGCIAWTLALDIPGAQVTATDLSQDALDLAAGQPFKVRRPCVRPVFARADVLDVQGTVDAFRCGDVSRRCGLLTANPPYVMVEEKPEMRANVLDYEPHMAIFAPEGDPLRFHVAIAEIAAQVLIPGGKGIVEINSALEKESAEVFARAGFRDVETIPDYFDRPRFISFSRP